MIVEKINAYWVLDSRGNPTIEVEIKSGKTTAIGSSPSGASTGAHEAIELRDNGNEFHGKGVNKAIERLKEVKGNIEGNEFSSPEEFDNYLRQIDGSENKSNLGGNTTTALSIAFHKLYSAVNSIEIFELFNKTENAFPYGMFNIINGGKHAGNSLAIQEFMIVPMFEKISQNIKVASEVYHQLKKNISKKYGTISTSVGDEGGFAPPIKTSEEAILLLEKSIEEMGYMGRVRISIDSAADSFYEGEGKYNIDGKTISKEELVDYYVELSKSHSLLSIEDPFYEEHVEEFAELKSKVNSLIIGDDLTVTNTSMIEKAAQKKAIDGVIIKINQIGTVSEAYSAILLCKKKGLKRIVSHRSGETEDSFIADFAYGAGTEFIKTGAPARGERTSKYNRLIRIEINGQ